MTTNKFGLSRHIPNDVALEVRRRSKFGCVLCRCAIYQYEHIEPEFSEARKHDPNDICLLCGGCHDRVTRGRIAKKTVRQAYVDTQKSSSIRRPFDDFDLAAQQISIKLGTATFLQPSVLIRINGEDILALAPPTEGRGFPRLSGIFYNNLGSESFRISDNTWEGPAEAWDIEVVGRRVIVKMEEKRTALALEISPPNFIHITHLDMFKDNCHLLCNDDRLLVGQTHHSDKSYIGLGNFECHGAKVGIAVDSQTGLPPRPIGLRMIGGGGIILDGTGISICEEAGPMKIGQIEVWTA